MMRKVIVYLLVTAGLGISTICCKETSEKPKTDLSVPEAPTVIADDKQLYLSWTAVDSAIAYEVWYNTTDNSATAIRFGTDITTTDDTITGLINGTTYYVWLKAKDSAGITEFSASAKGIPHMSTIFIVPTTIDGTGATDVTADLNNWIKTIPEGTVSNVSVIKFPTGNTYLLSQGIQFKNRSYLTFDGYGAKLKLNPSAGFSQLQSLFLLGRNYNGFFGGTNKNIIIRGFEFEASNPTPGVWNASRESAHAVEIDNSDSVEVYDILAHGLGGDGFKTTNGHHLWIHNNHIQDAGRQGVSIISGDHILIENNQFDDMGYFILDIEPNDSTQSVTDVVFRNNTAESWGPDVGVGAGFVACGCGTAYNKIGNITIIKNTITGSSNATLRSFFNQKEYKRLYNIVFSDNKASQTAVGPVLVFKSIDGLTITGNTQPLSLGTLFTITNCTNVSSM